MIFFQSKITLFYGFPDCLAAKWVDFTYSMGVFFQFMHYKICISPSLEKTFLISEEEKC